MKYDIVELLLKQPNIDINFKDKITIYFSKFFPNLHTKFLIMKQCTSLHMACYHGYTRIAELLLRQQNIDSEVANKIIVSLSSSFLSSIGVSHTNSNISIFSRMLKGTY